MLQPIGPTSRRRCARQHTDVDFELDIEHEDESRVKLVDLAARLPSVFLYEYDFGDSWDHVVIVEDYWRGDRDAALPLRVGGARACPPEDVGGKPGYEQFLSAVLGPAHEEHERLLTWVGGSFEPEAFNVEEANGRLKRLRPRGRARTVGR